MAERRRDYVPENALKFREFMNFLLTYVNAKKTAWAIPIDRLNALVGAFDSFSDFLETVFTSPLPWQNERGIRGTWSEYKTAIVP